MTEGWEGVWDDTEGNLNKTIDSESVRTGNVPPPPPPMQRIPLIGDINNKNNIPARIAGDAPSVPFIAEMHNKNHENHKIRIDNATQELKDRQEQNGRCQIIFEEYIFAARIWLDIEGMSDTRLTSSDDEILADFERKAGIVAVKHFRHFAVCYHDKQRADIVKKNYGKDVGEQLPFIVHWDAYPPIAEAVLANLRHYGALRSLQEDSSSHMKNKALRTDASLAPEMNLPKAHSAIGRPDNAHPKMLSEKERIENFKRYYCDELNNHELLRLNQTLPPHRKFSFDLPHHIKEEIWQEQRKEHGYEGDCRYAWEKFLDLSFAEQMPQAAEIDTSEWPDTAKARDAKTQLQMITQRGINKLAAQLNGRDTVGILTWGEKLNKQRAATFKQENGAKIREVDNESNDIKAALADLENLLRAQKPAGLRGIFFRAHVAMGRHKELEERRDGLFTSHSVRTDRIVDYRAMNPFQKMARAEQILAHIESYYTSAVDVQLERYQTAQNNEKLAHAFQDLTSLYATALKKNRTRLIAEGAGADTIDTRVSELSRAEAVCYNELGHAVASAALHLELRAQMREILDITLPAYRTQMQTAYLQALGKQALSAEFAKEALGAMVLDKTRAAELADNLDALADQVCDLAGLQQAMSNNEKLVLEHKQPIALEYQKVLALPAPDAKDNDPAPA